MHFELNANGVSEQRLLGEKKAHCNPNAMEVKMKRRQAEGVEGEGKENKYWF